MTTREPRIWATVDSETSKWIADYAQLTSQGRGSAVGGVVSTFKELMRTELHRVPLTKAEADTLADILNGSTHLTSSPPVLGSVLYAKARSYETRPRSQAQINLEDKLTKLGPSADLALRIAFARLRALPERERESIAGVCTARAYRNVGLNIVDKMDEK